MKKAIVAALLIAAIGCDIHNKEDEPDGIIFESLLGPQNEHSQELFFSLARTMDKGYIITGLTGGIGFGQDNVLLMKVDAGGQPIWTKSFGTEGVGEFGRKVIVTQDGGYLITGHTTSDRGNDTDIYLIKTDASGNLLWEKKYGADFGDEGRDLLPTNNGYYMLGTSVNGGNNQKDFNISRLDLNGNLLWSKLIGSMVDDLAHKMIELKNGTLLLGGYTWDATDYVDIYLINVNSDGQIIWDKRIDGPENAENSGDVLGGMKTTPDGGFIITGTQSHNFFQGFSGRAWVIKFAEDGTQQWQRTFGELGGNDARGEEIVIVDNGYMMFGSKLRDNETDYYLVRMDQSGNLLWDHLIHNSVSDQGKDILYLGDGIFTIAGDGYDLDQAQQVYLMSFKNKPF